MHFFVPEIQTMYYRILILSALSGLSSIGMQAAILHGTVKDAASGQGIEFATVAAFRSSDTTIVSGSISDSTGAFAVDGLTAGQYFIRVSFVGYADYTSDMITMQAQDQTLPDIFLQPGSQNLDAVVVKAQQKLIETIPGGIVYHADQVLTNDNGTVLDMMKNVPDILVDKDEHISIRGNTDIIVNVDGTATNLSGDDLTNFLKQLPANMVESVEVITTPGAKYDAEGGGGIINIKTKQNKSNGKNGTFTAGAGTLGSYNGSANYFANSSTLRLTLSYSYNHNIFRANGNGQRENYLNPDPLYYYIDGLDQDGHSNSQYAKAGLDFSPDPKNTVGASLSFGTNGGNFNIINTETALYPDHNTESGSYYSNVGFDFSGYNYSANAHYLHKTKKEGGELDLDANYSDYVRHNQTPSVTDFYDAAGNPLPGLEELRSDSTEFRVQIFTTKLDYTLPLPGNSKLEAGLKNTLTHTDNDLSSFTPDSISGEWTGDSAVSNLFTYHENVAAAYLNYTGTVKKIGFTFGLRAEHTDIQTESGTLDARYGSHYLDFFPSGNLQYGLKKGGSLSLDYSRRIDRPVYQWLNPFVDKSTPFTWFSGNPYLKPYYTDAATLTYSKYIAGKHFVSASLYYQHMRNIITQYFEYAGDGIYYLTLKNVNDETNAGFTLTAQSAAAKWLDIMLNATAYRNAVSNQLTSVPIDPRNSVSLYGSLTFKFWHNTSLQCTGNYNSPSTSPQGYFEGFYSVGAGIKKTFFDKHLSVNVNVRDIFNSMHFSNTFVDDSFHSTFTFKPDSRIGSISLSWKFGQAGPMQRQSDKDEDDKRVNFDRQ